MLNILEPSKIFSQKIQQLQNVNVVITFRPPIFSLAVKWSQESYNVTYDFRMRSWFSEAMTSPKDVFILLDTSGSMEGIKTKLSKQVINDILDTLNDNDFVNIYTFTNVTQPVVDCFNDTLVQVPQKKTQ